MKQKAGMVKERDEKQTLAVNENTSLPPPPPSSPPTKAIFLTNKVDSHELFPASQLFKNILPKSNFPFTEILCVVHVKKQFTVHAGHAGKLAELRGGKPNRNMDTVKTDFYMDN